LKPSHHCEERSDEAIQRPPLEHRTFDLGKLDGFASLAMTGWLDCGRL
jgi:hypothetical protein